MVGKLLVGTSTEAYNYVLQTNTMNATVEDGWAHRRNVRTKIDRQLGKEPDAAQVPRGSWHISYLKAFQDWHDNQNVKLFGVF